jgi:ribonucrease Y
MDLLTSGAGSIIFIVLATLIPAIVIGLLLSAFLYKRKLRKNQQALEEKSRIIIKEAELQAENIKKDKIIEAKDKLFKMKQEFEEEANRKKNQIISKAQRS